MWWRVLCIVAAAMSGGATSFVIYFALVLAIVAIMLSLSYVLGQRHQEAATNYPYEAGIAPTGSAHQPFAERFYLQAMLFVIFDLETVFIVAWAVAARDVGVLGYVILSSFVVVLLASLFYLGRLGALSLRRRGS